MHKEQIPAFVSSLSNSSPTTEQLLSYQQCKTPWKKLFQEQKQVFIIIVSLCINLHSPQEILCHTNIATKTIGNPFFSRLQSMAFFNESMSVHKKKARCEYALRKGAHELDYLDCKAKPVKPFSILPCPILDLKCHLITQSWVWTC